MSDIKAIVGAAEELRAKNRPMLIATVVRVRGSAYRRPGARMILSEEGWMAGSVSGGCLEGDVIKKGWWRTREGGAALVTYDARAEEGERGWSVGLGCDGVVDVLLERVDGAARTDPLRFVARCRAAQERGAMATVFHADEGVAPVGARACMRVDGTVRASEMSRALEARLTRECRAALMLGSSAVVTCHLPEGSVEALVEVVVPPPRLFVFGAGFDAVPLVTMASGLGWDVIVHEPHARFVTRERFRAADQIVAGEVDGVRALVDASDRAMCVVMGHDVGKDRAALAMLLASRARSIGVLGPRRRTERILAEIPGARADDARVHGPIGLEIGAETPQEIALAVVAEIQTELARAPAVSLRERSGPIHAAASP